MTSALPPRPVPRRLGTAHLSSVHTNLPHVTGLNRILPHAARPPHPRPGAETGSTPYLRTASVRRLPPSRGNPLLPALLPCPRYRPQPSRPRISTKNPNNSVDNCETHANLPPMTPPGTNHDTLFRAAAEQALQVLIDIMADPASPAAERRRAATVILNTAARAKLLTTTTNRPKPEESPAPATHSYATRPNQLDEAAFPAASPPPPAPPPSLDRHRIAAEATEHPPLATGNRHERRRANRLMSKAPNLARANIQRALAAQIAAKVASSPTNSIDREDLNRLIAAARASPAA